MPIEINSQDVLWISGDLYCLTPEALTVALEQLRIIGYNTEDMRDPETDSGKRRAERGVTVAEVEADQSSYLWYVRLPDIRKGKCNSCGSYITTAGIWAHGNPCENCGEPTSLNIIPGTDVRFYFRTEEKRHMFSPDVWMTVKRWDEDEGYLYLEYKFQKHGSMFTLFGEKAEQYFHNNADKWELVEEDREKLIKLRYKGGYFVDPEDVISMQDRHGGKRNAEIVKIWQGVEYPEYSRDFPLPESFHIYECWRWERLEPSPTLHKRVLQAAGQNDDKGWHYQDGRPYFRPAHFAQMGLYIRYFTTLDADAWDEQSQRFRLDGPGGIDDVAYFCYSDAEVEDRPNIGNFLVGLGKFGSGQSMSEGEAKAMKRAAFEDPATQDFAKEFVTGEHFRR